MARDLEAINKVRVENGLAPLDKLPEQQPANGDDGGHTDPKENENPDPPAPPKKDKKPEPDNEAADIEDDKLLQALDKRGIKVANIDDLKPKPDPAVTAEKREADKLSYALSKGNVSKKLYDNYVRDTLNPQNLVFEQYAAEQKAADSTLTDDEIRDEFENRFGMNAESGSRQFQRGVKEIGVIADKLLRDKYPTIYNIDAEFDRYETDQQNKQHLQNLIKTKAPVYKRDVEALITSDLKKI